MEGCRAALSGTGFDANRLCPGSMFIGVLLPLNIDVPDSVTSNPAPVKTTRHLTAGRRLMGEDVPASGFQASHNLRSTLRRCDLQRMLLMRLDLGGQLDKPCPGVALRWATAVVDRNQP